MLVEEASQSDDHVYRMRCLTVRSSAGDEMT